MCSILEAIIGTHSPHCSQAWHLLPIINQEPKTLQMPALVLGNLLCQMLAQHPPHIPPRAQPSHPNQLCQPLCERQHLLCHAPAKAFSTWKDFADK